MKSWICSCLWTVLVLTNVSADPSSPPRYAVHHTSVSFEKAVEDCSRGGVLTTLATEQEAAEILGVISESSHPETHNKLEFWVGLRKIKKECVTPTKPLRGFKWIEDGGEDSQVSQWTVEPEHTCTTVRCAKLQVDLHGPMVNRWGLIPVTCKDTHRFICKLTGGTPRPPKPAAPEPEPATTQPTTTEPEPTTVQPTAPEPEPATTAPHQPEHRPASQKPEPTGPEPPTQRPGADLKPDLGSEAAPESGSCQLPDIHDDRSIILENKNRSRIKVECWTGDPVDLHCSGHPPVWRLLDNSPANLTSICQRCDDGFKRDASGNCVDVDECGGGGEARCRDTCLNTEGSFRCVCTDEDGKHQDEDSPACAHTATDGDGGALSGVLIWALIGVGALLVLLVLVAVTVKCCLMRRSKKRAMKKAEKMAMKSKDDKDSVNEKIAI